MKCSVVLPPSVEASLKHLHPALKQKIKAALKTIEEEPYIGKPLQGKLTGLMSFRATHYRIVYQILAGKRKIEVVDIGPRKGIYEKLFNWKLE